MENLNKSQAIQQQHDDLTQRSQLRSPSPILQVPSESEESKSMLPGEQEAVLDTSVLNMAMQSHIAEAGPINLKALSSAQQQRSR